MPNREEKVVLSYSHTVSAAVEILNIAEEVVKKFGESSSDLKKKITSDYGSAKWKQVQDKSLVNEKSRNVQERQKEFQKQQAKINRATEKLLASKCGDAGKLKPKVVAKPPATTVPKSAAKPPAAAVSKAAGKPPATAAPQVASKPTAIPQVPRKHSVVKAASKPSKALKNMFASLEESDSE